MGGSYKDAKKAGAVYNPAREAAAKWASGKPIVKLRDMLADVQFPLYRECDIEAQVTERETRILYRDTAKCT